MLLEAKNIWKAYGELPVLKGVNFQLEEGQIVSIVGASGAGKSTLLHILGTLDAPDQGELLFRAEPYTMKNRKKLAEFRNLHLGFIFQFHNLLPEFTALENVCIPGWIQKNKNDTEQKGLELLELMGLKDRADHKPGELSGGEQQRVAVARALINQPDVVFADEPSGNLDSQNAKELHQLFLTLRKELNQTFVLVTHNEELAQLADEKREMKDGILY